MERLFEKKGTLPAEKQTRHYWLMVPLNQCEPNDSSNFWTTTGSVAMADRRISVAAPAGRWLCLWSEMDVH
jgi:hypothetical protein